MIALIDGDIVAYRCAATAENDDSWVSIARAKESIERMLETTKCDEYQVWLSDKRENNFRTQLYSAYKANRTQPPPKHLNSTKEYLYEHWEANLAEGQEADDAIGIEATKAPSQSVICSIDKDLRQIPTTHFHFVNEELFEVDVDTAYRNFLRQLLTGDRTDNILKPDNLKGFGTKKIDALFGAIEDSNELFDTIRDMYQNDDALLLNGRLLWIRREPEQLWSFE